MRWMMTGVCWLAMCCVLFAEVEIPKELRVKNFPSGCCVWCSVENLGNIHGVTALKGIAKYRDENYGKKTVLADVLMMDQFGRYFPVRMMIETNEAPGSPERVQEEFARLKVKYKMQTHDSKDMEIIKEAMDKNLGCAVGFKDYPGDGDRHMVTLTELTDKKCVFVDNNGECKRIEKTRKWFDDHWSGYTIIVYPEKGCTKTKK